MVPIELDFKKKSNLGKKSKYFKKYIKFLEPNTIKPIFGSILKFSSYSVLAFKNQSVPDQIVPNPI